MMRITLDIPWDVVTAVDLLNGMVRAAARGLERNPLPLLWLSGVVYRPEPLGAEVWLDPHACHGLGEGDCEDLAVWRAAELIVRGAGALLPGDPGYGGAPEDVAVRLRPMGAGTFHALAEYRVGGVLCIDDPSEALGMSGRLPDLTLQRWAKAGVRART